MSNRTVVKWGLPPGTRSVISAEAQRQRSGPSKIVEDILRKYLPAFLKGTAEEAQDRSATGQGGEQQ